MSELRFNPDGTVDMSAFPDEPLEPDDDAALGGALRAVPAEWLAGWDDLVAAIGGDAPIDDELVSSLVEIAAEAAELDAGGVDAGETSADVFDLLDLDDDDDVAAADRVVSDAWADEADDDLGDLVDDDDDFDV